MSAFETLGVCPELIIALSTPPNDWLLPTPVQQEAIPLILTGGDVMVAAETGSGKTGAFALPILQIVFETLRGAGKEKKSEMKEMLPKANARVEKAFFEMRGDLCTIKPNGVGAVVHGNWSGCRANVGIMKGKFYWECTVIGSGIPRIGWATIGCASLNIGTDNQSFGYGGTAKKAFNRKFEAYGETYGASDIIGCWIDRENEAIHFSKNGIDMGMAYKMPPFLKSQPLFPAVTLKNTEIQANFGALPFKYPPSAGYRAINQAKMDETNFWFDLKHGGKKNTDGPLALIILPTKDLCQQVYEEVKRLASFMRSPKVNVKLCMGGARMTAGKDSHIICATMGALQGAVKSKKIPLGSVRFFVLDEADRMLDGKQGSQKEVLFIYNQLSLSEGVQVMLFSATLHSPDIKRVSDQVCKHPTWVDLKGKDFVPDTVTHSIILVDPVKDIRWRNEKIKCETDGVHFRDKCSQYTDSPTKNHYSEWVKILKPLIVKQLIDTFDMSHSMIFCRTRTDCDNLEEYLVDAGGGRKFSAGSGGKENPYSCVALHSGRQQFERKRNLDHFKKGEVRFIICTDVAARGIDIKDMECVINVTMPSEAEDYIHRVGRCGRQDKHGMAFSIVSKYEEKVWYHSNCRTKWPHNDCVKKPNSTNLINGKPKGCCIWYNESEILAAVEKRLSGLKIPKLSLDELRPDNAKKIRTRVAMKDELVSTAKKNVEELRPMVEVLQELEVAAQNNFLRFSSAWKNAVADLHQVEEEKDKL